jgi:TetR/AcrR family transcriptional regulator, ethionamide resistance regulator
MERVLAAVEDLLADGDRFTEIPVLKIAERAGMSRTNFYQYFPNKSQVLIQVADLASEEFFAAPTEWFIADESLDSGVAGVENVIRAMLTEFRKHWTVMRALGELASYDAEVAEFWFGRIQEFIDAASESVARWRSRGLVDDRVGDESVSALTWMVERTVAQHVLNTGIVAAADDRVISALARTIWLTISSGPE